MSNSHRPDYFLMILIGILVVFGLIVLSSASVVMSYQKFNDNYYMLKHQIIYGLLPGLFLFFLTLKINYRKWEKISLILLVFNVLLLIAVYLPGIGESFDKAKSWIKIGVIVFQPSELIKLTLILYLAAWLGKREDNIKTLEHGLIPFLGIVGLITGLVILQPDLGTASIIVFISLVIYFLAKAPKRDIIFLFLIVLIGGFLAIKMAPYRFSRIEMFLNPGLDPQGKGYQINQAFLAIGSGGIFGRGLGLSTQKFQYLPEPAGDSVFAIMAEELGFIFSAALVTLFFLLAQRGFKIAKRCDDNFGKLTAYGITSLFVFQAFINICTMVGLMPLTGVPLPFISYGGSALMTFLAGAGILLNISKYTRL